VNSWTKIGEREEGREGGGGEEDNNPPLALRPIKL
jgi:hypothetical protein